MLNSLRPIGRCIRRVQSASFSTPTKQNAVYQITESMPDKGVVKLGAINPSMLRSYIDPVIAADDYFQLNNIVSIEEMFEARVHYGHKMGTLKENMKWAIYGERLDVCIFDLEVTRRYMEKALKFLACLSYQDAIILFISANRSHIEPVETFAAAHGQYSHTRKWLKDTLLNSRALFGAPIRLPDLVIFTGTLTSVLEPHPAIVECAKLAIPTIGIVDSNAEPNYITYPIPGNDDSLSSLSYYLKMFHHALEAGKQVRLEQDKQCQLRNRQSRNGEHHQKQLARR